MESLSIYDMEKVPKKVDFKSCRQQNTSKLNGYEIFFNILWGGGTQVFMREESRLPPFKIKHCTLTLLNQ